MVRAAEFRDERTDGWVEPALRIGARLGGTVRGLHDHVRLVITLAAIDRANDRIIIVGVFRGAQENRRLQSHAVAFPIA